MNTLIQIKRIRGIGMLEVLITSVVIAVGLLALASMQGGFMSESANNKTRAEAMVLAEQKMEEIRNYISRKQYDDQTTGSDTVTGVNAAFNRGWTITTIDARNIGLTVTVSWGAQGDQQVALSSQVAFVEPSNTAGLASGRGEASHLTGPGLSAPHPNVGSSERAVDIVDIFEPDGTTLKPGFTSDASVGPNFYRDEDDNLYRLDGGGYPTGRLVELVSLLEAFEIDLRYEVNNVPDDQLPENPITLYTKRSDLDGDGKFEVIDLYTANFKGGIGDGSNLLNNPIETLLLGGDNEPDGTATRVHRYFGGVILRIKGDVFTVNHLDDIKIDHNREDMYCVFNPGETQVRRKYACYPGGSCANGPSGLNSDVTQCANPAVADVRVGPGGWRGNVGLINVDDEGGDKESVCYLEEILSEVSPRSTARKYYGLLGSVEQGINQSYSCQDFLIVGRRNNFNQLAAACALGVSNLNVTSLPRKEVIRNIDETNTVVFAINNSSCNNLAEKSYTVTVTISNATDTTSLTVEGGIGSTSCVKSDNSYTCTGETKANVLTVNANDGDLLGTCIIELNTTPSPAEGNCNITLISPPTYIIKGPIEGLKNTNNLSITITDVFNKTEICSFTQTQYTCTISTLFTSIRIEGKQQKNEPYCQMTELDGINAQPGQTKTIEPIPANEAEGESGSPGGCKLKFK